MEWSNYNYLYYSNKHKVYLGYNSITNVLLEFDEFSYKEIMGLKDNTELINEQDESHNVLIKAKFFVEKNINDIRNIQLFNLTRRFDNSKLNLTIAPTRACNFNCTYCYENNRINLSFTDNVKTGIINFIKKNNPQQLNITWYGGEPLLAIGDILHLTHEIKKLKINVSAIMVTNGYLLDRIVDHLSELNLSMIQVTIDGMKEIHNSRRKMKNNEDSFTKIIENIGLVLENDKNIRFSIRVNVDNENKEEFIKVKEFLAKKFNSNRISTYAGYVHDDFCQGISCIESSEQKASFISENYYENNVIDKDIYPRNIGHGCMMRAKNALLIGPEGEFYKCWHHLGNETLSIGNVFEDNVINNYSLYSKFMLANDSLFNEKCINCFLYPSCFGGCSDLRVSNEEGLSEDKVCIPAKKNIEEFLDIYYDYKSK